MTRNSIGLCDCASFTHVINENVCLLIPWVPEPQRVKRSRTGEGIAKEIGAVKGSDPFLFHSPSHFFSPVLHPLPL